MTTERRRRWPRILIAIAAVFAVLIAGLFAYTSLTHMNNPATIARYLMTPSSELGHMFPYRTVAASDTPRPIPEDVTYLPATVSWKGADTSTEEVLATTKTNALLVMCDGTLVNEWYREPEVATSRQS